MLSAWWIVKFQSRAHLSSTTRNMKSLFHEYPVARIQDVGLGVLCLRLNLRSTPCGPQQWRVSVLCLFIHLLENLLSWSFHDDTARISKSYLLNWIKENLHVSIELKLSCPCAWMSEVLLFVKSSEVQVVDNCFKEEAFFTQLNQAFLSNCNAY